MVQLTPSSASEWQPEVFEQGYSYKLPSGRIMALRPMGINVYLRIGFIPDPLTSFVIDLMEKGLYEKVTDPITGKVAFNRRLPETKTKQQYADWLDLLDAICEASAVSPKVVGRGQPRQPDELSVDMLSLTDKHFIFSLFGEPVERLKTYFLLQERGLESVAADADNPSSSVGDPGR